ncbi:MAG: hypothetical protein H0T71_16215, partial [Acidobacteria bacterium]|nr:hypothetical protein [Acidobacteriota bacterium]
MRARFLIDPAARFSVHIGAFGGSQFVSGWNNTGGGIGEVARDFNVKQLFVAAEPVTGLEFQVGGLYLNRGENTEVSSYDNDGYILGERATFRTAAGAFAQLAATVGHIGEFRTPNVFERFRHLGDLNYGQVLVGGRLGPRINVSVDYTYEAGRDILRQGVSVRLPPSVKLLTALKFEAYQRLTEVAGQGFNVSGELRLTPAFAMSGGVLHIERHCLIPGYSSPNADRVERGTRFFTQGSYAISRELAVGWYQGEAFNTGYVIPNQHRFEILV